ncbi:hypothetical protein FA95DRAFT_1601801 [Auriscalpium vulgare]|uniref:Uncharacterized protein n=1 Tax=Auriscalpium vulgare TaxID=40419 RepID=A0ACB8S7D4_9AGAM|nr:hypothetical protein FA95DRAFT_1601801 [Auriscalpium vulgare]
MISRTIAVSLLALTFSAFTAQALPGALEERNHHNHESCPAVQTVTLTVTAGAASTSAAAHATTTAKGSNNNGKGTTTSTSVKATTTAKGSNNNGKGTTTTSIKATTTAKGATTAKGTTTSTSVKSTTTAKGSNNNGKGTTTSTSVKSTTTAKGSNNNGKTTTTTKSTSTAGSKGTTTTSSVLSTTTAKGSNSTTTTSSAASTSTSVSGNNGTATNDDPQKSLTLDPRVIASGFANDGQQPPVAGQVASLTSTNNFINFCLTKAGVPLTNGAQVKTGSCNAAPMGVIPATTNMPSSKFTFPPNFGRIAANTAFTVTMALNHLDAGHFTNAQETYYAGPQFLNAQGDIVGHTHFTIEQIDSFGSTKVLDPNVFAFFKGVNGAAVNGVVSADVTAGLPVGFYRLASINAAQTHQPVLAPVAQHGSLDDMIYFQVTDDGAATPPAASAVSSAAAAATSSVAAVKGGAAASSAAPAESSAAAAASSAAPAASATAVNKPHAIGAPSPQSPASTSAAPAATATHRTIGVRKDS